MSVQECTYSLRESNSFGARLINTGFYWMAVLLEFFIQRTVWSTAGSVLDPCWIGKSTRFPFYVFGWNRLDDKKPTVGWISEPSEFIRLVLSKEPLVDLLLCDWFQLVFCNNYTEFNDIIWRKVKGKAIILLFLYKFACLDIIMTLCNRALFSRKLLLLKDISIILDQFIDKIST